MVQSYVAKRLLFLQKVTTGENILNVLSYSELLVTCVCNGNTLYFGILLWTSDLSDSIKEKIFVSISFDGFKHFFDWECYNGIEKNVSQINYLYYEQSKR